MPKKGKKLDAQRIEQQMTAYSRATPAAFLDDAFGKWDRKTDNMTSTPMIDRSEHIIVDGRLAKDFLMEKFEERLQREQDGESLSSSERIRAYSEFYKKDGKDLLNQMVTSAVANGQKVEAFIPDGQGRIQNTPMTLSPRGYTPASPLAKPAQLSRWQKFWGKLGFYKKERQAIKDYETQQKTWQKVKFCNKAGRSRIINQSDLMPEYLQEMRTYHPEMVEDMAKNFPAAEGNPSHLGQSNGFRTVRGSFGTIMMGYLATRRDDNGNLLYTNDQLFDLNDPRMQRARADAMKEIYDRYKAGPPLEAELKKKAEIEANGGKYEIDAKIVQDAAAARAWLAETQHEAAHVLQERTNKQAAKLDFTRPDVIEQKGYREFAMLCETAFDQSQDMYVNRGELDRIYGEGTYWKESGRIGTWSQIPRFIGNSMVAQKNVLTGVAGDDEAGLTDQMSNVFRERMYLNLINRSMAKPDGQFSDSFDDVVMNSINAASSEAGYDYDAMEAHTSRGEPLPPLMAASVSLARERIGNHAEVERQIVSGVFAQRVQVQGISAEQDAKAPVKISIRDAAAVEREMAQPTQQNVKTGAELEL